MPISEGGRFSPTDRIVSPGVFTRENQVGTLTQAVENIGAAIVGPFNKGPAFLPITVTNQSDLESLFGKPDGVLYTPLAAQKYLREQGSVTVVRAGGLGGYHQNDALIISAIPGQYQRISESGSYSGSLIGTSVTNTSKGTFIASGSLIGTFFSGIYSGSQKLIGNFATTLTGAGTLSASVLYAVETATAVSQTNSSSANVTNLTSTSFLTSGSTAQSSSILFPVSFSSNDIITVSASINVLGGSGGSFTASLFSGSATSGNGIAIGTSTYNGSVTNGIVSFQVSASTGATSNGYLKIFTPSSLSQFSLYSLNATKTLGTWQVGSETLVSSSVSALIVTYLKIPSSGNVTTTATVISGDLCGSDILYVSGSLNGPYGNLNTNSWVPDDVDTVDECGELVTGSATRRETVLAVLSNTAHDTAQNLYGFSGSILNSETEISTEYSLTLKTTYTDPDTSDLVSSSYGTYNFSLDTSSPRFLTNVFGVEPKAGFLEVPIGQKIEAAYTYTVFPNNIETIMGEMVDSGSWKVKISTKDDAIKFTDGVTPDLGDSAFDITNAYTPWINSQKVAPFSGSVGNPIDTRYNLFKVHTTSDGTIANKLYKIEISNVKSSGAVPGSDYGTFTLSVRDYYDTDKKPKYIEIFQNLNLNPDSADFVARRIGDRYSYINNVGKVIEFGDYSNQSRNIRIEMTTAPYPKTSIPFGFDAYATPIGGDFSTQKAFPQMTFTSASIYTKQIGKYASGIVFNAAPTGADAELAGLYPNGTAEGSERDNVRYFAPIPANAGVGLNSVFDLEEVCDLTPSYVPAEELTNSRQRKFALGFQGGFDGNSPSVPILVGNDIVSTNQQGFDCSTNTSNGTYSYTQCIAALSNQDEYDINLISVPGLNYEYNPYILTLIIDMCEKRGDVFFPLDLAPNKFAGSSTIDTITSLANSLDTNYAAAYYPWIKIKDTNTNRIILSPPSLSIPAVFAGNDKVAAEWYAPAGLNRGGISDAVGVSDRLTQDDRDELYVNRVNPIATSAGQSGIYVWGQKTLQQQEGPLSSINVRRLLIALKKFIASASRYLVFEQNDSATRNKFLNIVNPYLQSVQQRSGLYAFVVEMNDDTTTPDLVDRGIMYGKIKLKPTRSAEEIVLDFDVLPSGGGASFGF